ncbi:MAG: glycosyltransferase family 4 protein [Mycolicibacterium sp.]|uniref:glycosyltransferase family 4 protein n=1 Tax=Mycolicibacterium sp. TaxID=2320850 RepID=UPI003D0D549C
MEDAFSPSIVQVMGWRSQQYGSFEHFLVNLARVCSARGAQVHFVFPDPPASEVFRADASAAGAEFHEISSLRNVLDLRFDARLAQLFRRVGATHLQAHFGPESYHSLATARAVGVRRRYMTKHIAPEQSAISELRHRVLAAQVETMFTVSDDVGQRLIGLGVPTNKLETVYLGVDVDAYCPNDPAIRADVRLELGLAETTRIVLSTSHLRPGKGVELLAELACALTRDPGGVAIVAAGDGPLRAKLEKESAGLIHFLGVRQDVPRLLAAADVFVLPTTGTEGMPLGVFEALAAGVPVVASDVADLGRVLGGTAAVVPPGDGSALLAEIRRILLSPLLAACRAREGYKLVNQSMGVQRAAETYADHYFRPRPAIGRRGFATLFTPKS